jgi:hypothetical protein
MRRGLRVLCAGAAAALSGCVYVHTVEPLTTDFRGTRVVSATGRGDVKQIDYYVRFSWSANAIGEIAKDQGFEEVHYADLETLQILGVWTQQWAHVYGTKAAE